jgi:hypothetical protein
MNVLHRKPEAGNAVGQGRRMPAFSKKNLFLDFAQNGGTESPRDTLIGGVLVAPAPG